MNADMRRLCAAALPAVIDAKTDGKPLNMIEAIVRAVLVELKVPSPRMLDLADDICLQGKSDELHSETRFSALIDAALKEV